MKIYIDLHTHSTASDGTDSPKKIVQKAVSYAKKHEGKAFIALTDHDTVAGIPEFIKEAALHPDHIRVVPGLEFSTFHKSETIHILGYGFDHGNKNLLNALEKYRNSRNTRNEKIISKLQSLGIKVSMKDITKENPDEAIGRPLIASHLMKNGYVSSIKEAFELYIGKGKPCYAGREKPTPEEVISLIHEAGGYAVLAHPVLYKKLSSSELEEFIQSLKDLGLDGMEIYYSRNNDEDTRHFQAIAEKHGFFFTGGSDYHGLVKPDIRLFTGTGHLDVPEDILKSFPHNDSFISY